ncbi:scavenger receptor class B member 1 isoform X3 [Topomyia yanbarensis]|uniref:scavenger receptor class B member 1 isoform X3 n=1 Tax=Topomyia yanbarensis TaxID=2498891 RepID=UPI00273C0702|nr:scavenger receptor class B member 1 isoform X3 [Topomyia yanbarensis]
MKNFMHWLGNRFNSVRNHNCDNGTVGSFAAKRKNQTRQFSIVDSFFHSRKEGERTRYPKCIFILMAIGLLSVGIGVLSHFLHPYIRIFKWKLIFEAGGEVFELWKTPPVDLYINIFLFNVTNASEYLKGKADKMVFQEVGPYVYRELFSHQNVTFLANGTLFTKPSHPLIFQEHLSKGHKESDIFFLPNIALLGIAQIMSKNNYLFRLPLNLLIRQTKLLPLELQTAKQFMFGYETTITTLGNTFLPNWISFNKVGLIDRMYDFDEDFETIYTGSYDASMSGLYESYLGTSKLKQWKGDHCSNIQNASDGKVCAVLSGWCRMGTILKLVVYKRRSLFSKKMPSTMVKSIQGTSAFAEKLSGLPLALSVKFQINMAIGDIANIAECERFSNIVIPALWFEITMKQLPTSLRNRFLFYLYYLRVFDRIVYYLLFVGGGLLLLFAVLRVSYSLSASFSTLHRISSSTSSYKEVINHHQAHHKRRNSAKQEEGSDQERQHFLL